MSTSVRAVGEWVIAAEPAQLLPARSQMAFTLMFHIILVPIDQLTSWWNPTSISLGLLAVSMGAFLSAVYLVVEARRRGLPGLQRYFRVRAVAAGLAGLALGAATLGFLWADERQMFDRVVGRGWALIVIGTLALAATFVFAVRGGTRGVRVAAGVGVAALVWTWGVAQYPYLLPFELTIADGAGAAVTQRWLLAWFVVALLILGPALALLYVLDQRGELFEDPTTSRTPDDSPTPAGPA